MSKNHISLVAALRSLGLEERASTIELYEEENVKLREQLEVFEKLLRMSKESEECHAFNARTANAAYVAHDAEVRRLREQLAAAEKDRDEWKESCIDANQRFQAAEAKLRDAEVRLSGQTCFVPPEFQQELDELRAKLKASEEQEPYAHEVESWSCAEYEHEEGLWFKHIRLGGVVENGISKYRNWKPLYAKPVQPIDVQELHRECKWEFDAERARRVSAEQRIAELERVIAETFSQWCGRDLMHLELPEAVGMAIAKAREEGRLSAVLEGIVSVEASYDYEQGGIITPYLKVSFAKGTDSNELWKLRDKAKKMLASAPTPGEKP